MLRTLFLSLLCVLSSPLGAQSEPARPPDVALPDARKAKAELAAARDELEELAGPELSRRRARPVPRLSEEELGLSEKESARVKRLRAVEPEEWAAADREWVEELLPLDLRLRSVLRSEPKEGEGAGPDELAVHLLPLLRATRVLALRDRLELLAGEPGAFADGLELRERFAERLFLRPSLLGPMFGTAIHAEVLRDVRWVVGRAGTSRELLERMDVLLFRWRSRVPDPAAVVAREGLASLERGENLPGDLGGADDAAEAAFLAPMARDFADLARLCREEGCGRAAEVVGRRMEESEDPFRVVTDLLMPNYFGFLARLDGGVELTALAAAAVALRLEALETGRYPAALEDLPDSVVAALATARIAGGGLEYDPPGPGGSGSGSGSGSGGPRLRLTSDDLLSAWSESRRAELAPLLVWDLPALADARGAPGHVEREPPPGE